jgi:hypothetical protein
MRCGWNSESKKTSCIKSRRICLQLGVSSSKSIKASSPTNSKLLRRSESKASYLRVSRSKGTLILAHTSQRTEHYRILRSTPNTTRHFPAILRTLRSSSLLLGSYWSTTRLGSSIRSEARTTYLLQHSTRSTLMQTSHSRLSQTIPNC